MMRGKVILIEDEKDIVAMLRFNLEQEKYKVAAARDAETGLALVLRKKPDAVILDLMLPKMDGLEFLRRLRQESQVPVLILTAKGSHSDKVLGLKLGADDYLTKPFFIGELLARVEALLRRAACTDGGRALDGRVSRGELTVDVGRRLVHVGRAVIHLTTKEFEILRRLIQADGRVLSREHLLQRVWGHAEDVEVETRTVDQHIARLRKKLRKEGDRILTVPNCGYRLKAG